MVLCKHILLIPDDHSGHHCISSSSHPKKIDQSLTNRYHDDWFALTLGNKFNLCIGIDPLRGLDLTPAAFTITALTMIINISRLNLLNLMPTAREKVVDSMQDCLLVIDHNGRFVDLNPAMQQFISKLEKAKKTHLKKPHHWISRTRGH